MKQVLAIIRDECREASQAALARIGITGIAFVPVLGRGLQKGSPGVPGQEGALGRNAGLHLRRTEDSGTSPQVFHPHRKKKTDFLFVAKQMLIILVPDEQAPEVVQELIAVNQSGRHGDGKIFVCPIGGAIGIPDE